MTFRDYLRVARERRLLVLAVTAIFVIGAIGFSVQQNPVYEAEASLEFKSINTDTSTLGQRVDTGGETPEQRAAVAASTLIRTDVLDRAAKELKTPGRLPGGVTAQAEARTNLVIVKGAASSAEAAAALTNAVARAGIAITQKELRRKFADDADAQRHVLKEVKKETKRPGARRFPSIQEIALADAIASLDELSRVATPVVLRRAAEVPATPVSPKPVRNTVLGLLIGLTLGLVAAFVRDSLDRRFKTWQEVTEELHLPLLGFVPESVLGQSVAAGKGERKMSDEDLEGFRVLRTNVEFLDVDAPPKVLLVTSALPEEGKSTVAAALAAAYAMGGKRTLIVEGDLRRPTLAERTGIKATPGLSDYLVGRAEPAEILQTIAPPSAGANGNQAVAGTTAVPFVVITAGTPSPQPAELLRSKRCAEFFAQVRDAYDVVIVDSCPLLSVADTLELLPLADAVVMCVRASKTTRDQARAATAAMAHFPDRPTGAVITGVRARDQASYLGYYSYGYVYGGGRG